MPWLLANSFIYLFWRGTVSFLCLLCLEKFAFSIVCFRDLKISKLNCIYLHLYIRSWEKAYLAYRFKFKMRPPSSHPLSTVWLYFGAREWGRLNVLIRVGAHSSRLHGHTGGVGGRRHVSRGHNLQSKKSPYQRPNCFETWSLTAQLWKLRNKFCCKPLRLFYYY